MKVEDFVKAIKGLEGITGSQWKQIKGYVERRFELEKDKSVLSVNKDDFTRCPACSSGLILYEPAKFCPCCGHELEYPFLGNVNP